MTEVATQENGELALDGGIENPPVLPGSEPVEVDFFGGVEERERWYFPGQDTQFIEFALMTEGMRKQWQRKTNRGIKVNRNSQDAEINVDAASDREWLLKIAVKDWYIINPKKSNQPVAYTEREFAAWMERANPRLIDKLEQAIRDANPWMMDEMDPEAIREEIERLEKLYDKAVERRESKS